MLARFRVPFIIIFSCCYAGLILVDSLPASLLRERLTRYTNWVVQPLGLWQRWEVFAGEQAAISSRYVATYADGSTLVLPGVGLPARAQFLPNARTNFEVSLGFQKDKTYLTNWLTYLCRQPSAQLRFPRSITYEQVIAPVPRAGTKDSVLDPFTVMDDHKTVAVQSCK